MGYKYPHPVWQEYAQRKLSSPSVATTPLYNIAHRSPAGEEHEPLPEEHHSPLLLLYPRQRGFGLGQPEGHVHGAVQVDGGGQDGAGLLPTVGLVVQPA
jgi:hypothetical protein